MQHSPERRREKGSVLSGVVVLTSIPPPAHRGQSKHLLECTSALEYFISTYLVPSETHTSGSLNTAYIKRGEEI